MISAIFDSDLIIYAGYALIVGAVYIVTRMLSQEQESRVAQENLQDLRGRKASDPLVRITRPFFMQYVVPMVRNKPFWENKRKLYKRKLVSSGLRDELTPDELISFKLFLIVFFPIVGGFLRAG